jgi:predicted ATPase
MSKFFQLSDRKTVFPNAKSKVLLIENTWDDMFTFATTYDLYFYDKKAARKKIGTVKIGSFGLQKGRTVLPSSFNQLDKELHFSVGQLKSYYEKIARLGPKLRDKILKGLNDLSLSDEATFDAALKEKVTQVSLLRFVTPTTVRGQFRRLATGDVSLTRYEFRYDGPMQKDLKTRISLSFVVEPKSLPPTNIHAIIGVNGVGKTFLMDRMIRSLVEDRLPNKFGRFEGVDVPNNERLFGNLVSVSFSAFDDIDRLPEARHDLDKMFYSHVGLQVMKQSGRRTVKSSADLTTDFAKSVANCKSAGKIDRWKDAVRMLNSDTVLSEISLTDIQEATTEAAIKEAAKSIFRNLSSGHKIVLLTLTRLVETVEERTLVLLDEPESHLHPPLLSAFLRTLSALLIDNNGVAIIATHSPVVLQEIPASCIWQIRKYGDVSIAERLSIESFGENVGTLTREVFGLEVNESGYHKYLIESFDSGQTYETTIAQFNGHLGLEARAMLRAIVNTQSKKKQGGGK